jgi:hypothetical protein
VEVALGLAAFPREAAGRLDHPHRDPAALRVDPLVNLTVVNPLGTSATSSADQFPPSPGGPGAVAGAAGGRV